jgi:DNA-binding transcriptional MocR family regulator
MQQPTTLQKEIDPGVVDLAVGHPEPDLLPLQMMREASRGALADAAPEVLQYTYEPGSGYFRRALADFLSRHYDTPVAADSLFIDTGVSQGLDLFCSYFTRPGETVLVEDPTYFLALKIFKDYAVRVVSVPTGAEGVDTAALEEIARRERPAFFYTIPVHQNPSGFTQPAERRREVVDCAERYDFTVLADEVYHLLTYEGEVPKPYAAYLDSGQVVSLGSFSKIAAPGLRLGWFQASPAVLQRVCSAGLLDSGGSLNPFTALVMQKALEDGSEQKHLEMLRSAYASRRDAMDAALRQEAGDLLEWDRPRGGYFFWLRLKQGDARALTESARAHKVSFLPGTSFSPSGSFQKHLRLCFAHYPPERLTEGVKRLAAAIRTERSQ